MKYFNPSYLFKLWILSIPLFHTEKQKVQSMPIKSLTNLQVLPINLKQPTEIFNHKHRHKKYKKRDVNGGLENLEFFNGTCTNNGITFVKIIKEDFYCGVEEPWNNNKGVAILPYVLKDNEYHYLLNKEYNPLFKNKQIGEYSTITGGVENKTHYQTVINEMLEETGINVSNKKEKIYYLGKHYANKISTKEWYLYGIDLTDTNLDLNATYKGSGDGTIAEEKSFAKFVNKTILDMCNDVLSLAIYGKLNLNKKMESNLNISEINSTDLQVQPSTSEYTTPII
ncbi:hypothetical protein [Spiroplasma endosymbiont of Phycita roborella]|uniref:hypothetical protein n=1 Tax=Spiroplasma endosymbiont of Phycita roborella TaxID=3066311 RepID=UPI00313C8F79